MKEASTASADSSHAHSRQRSELESPKSGASQIVKTLSLGAYLAVPLVIVGYGLKSFRQWRRESRSAS